MNTMIKEKKNKMLSWIWGSNNNDMVPQAPLLLSSSNVALTKLQVSHYDELSRAVTSPHLKAVSEQSKNKYTHTNSLFEIIGSQLKSSPSLVALLKRHNNEMEKG